MTAAARAGSLLADTSGATAVLTALTLAAAMGFVALGIESATGLHERRQMQDSADAAALAGALGIRSGGSEPSALAFAVLRENAFTPETGYTISVKAPHPGQPGSRVDVDISRVRTARLGGFLDDEGGIIWAHAAAHLVERGTGCILGLATSNAIRIANPNDLILDGCTLLSTEQGLPLMRVAEADPYRDLPDPVPPPCSVRASVVRGPMTARSGATMLTFCGGLTIEAGGSLTLEPGVYVISGGPLLVRNGGTLSGRNATLLLTAGASVGFAPGAGIDLSAPESGPFAGLAIAGQGSSGSSSLEAGRSQRIVGAIHFPDQSVAFAGSASSPCTQIIANRITIVGPTRLENRCAETGARPMVDRIARLAE